MHTKALVALVCTLRIEATNGGESFEQLSTSRVLRPLAARMPFLAHNSDQERPCLSPLEGVCLLRFSIAGTESRVKIFQPSRRYERHHR